jgi:hypothetical protein
MRNKTFLDVCKVKVGEWWISDKIFIVIKYGNYVSFQLYIIVRSPSFKKYTGNHQKLFFKYFKSIFLKVNKFCINGYKLTNIGKIYVSSL